MPETTAAPAVQLAPEAPEAAAPGLGLRGLVALDPRTPLDAVELAAVLGCCKASVQRAARRGELPAPGRFMGRHVWTAAAVLAHLEKMQKPAR